MAGDTRDPQPSTSASSSTLPTTSKSSSSQWATFDPAPSPPSPSNTASSPPASANLIPGGTTNTAGGSRRESSFLDALRSIRLQELKEVHKKPCVRDALLVGIAGGFGVGGIRAILGATVWRTCTWAVSTFCFSSMGMYEFCQRKRALEMAGMKRAVEIVERKKIEIEKLKEEARKERRRLKEEEDEEREKLRKAGERKKIGSTWWNIW